MSGKLKYYGLSGLFGFLITYAVSAGNNLASTSLIRGLISFVIWFLLAFAVNWMIGFLKELPPEDAAENLSIPLTDEGKGENLDLVTPDETEELIDLLRQPSEGQANLNDFKPLDPPKLVTTPDDSDPEELAKIVRHLAEK